MSAHLGADYWHREWSNERGKLIKADARIATLERELSEAKEREARLRAHIQEAADDAQSNEMAAAVNGETYQVTYFKKLRDWHLAALEQNNG